MAKYQGHKNWNHWNVSLWMSNDYELYQTVTGLLRRYTKDRAARILTNMWEGQKTPDGAPYTFTTIRAAIVGWG